MRQKASKGLAFFVAIVMILALIPTSAFAEDESEPDILNGSGNTYGVSGVSVTVEGKNIAVIVPYTFDGNIESDNFIWSTKTGYGSATVTNQSADFPISMKPGTDSGSGTLTLQATTSGDPVTTVSSTYTVNVARKEQVKPEFKAAALSTTISKGETNVSISDDLFNAKYEKYDGAADYTIKFTTQNELSNGITLYAGTTPCDKDREVTFTKGVDNKTLKISAAGDATTGLFIFDVISGGEIIKTGVIFEIKANVKTLDVISLDVMKNSSTSVPLSTIKSRAGITGSKTISSITFTSSPDAVSGTLYKTSDAKTGNKMAQNIAYTEAEISAFRFIANTTAGTSTYNYTIKDSNNIEYNGTFKFVVPNITGDTEVKFTVKPDENLKFDPAKFNTASKNGTGVDLNYIVFGSQPSTSKGILYYEYKKSSSPKVKDDGTKYYYGSPDPEDSDGRKLSDVTFVPESTYSGTVTISYTGYNKDKVKFTGKISIEVKSDDTDIETLTVSVEKGGTKILSVSDFKSKFKKVTSKPLDYVKFDTDSATNWTLYYEYDPSSSKNKKISTGTEYYCDPSDKEKDLGKITFVPRSSYAGTIMVGYTGRVDNEDLTGKVKFVIGGGDEDPDADIDLISYTIPQNKTQTLSATAMNSKFKDAADDESLFYATFEQPDNGGTLYYGYVSPSNMGTKVSESTKYYRTASGSRKLINSITFVPKSGYSGTVYINYVGYDEDENYYDGIIRITVTADSLSKYFTDVTSNYSWAFAEIDSLYSRGIIKGTTSTAYSPAANIKRGDFMLMLYRAFNLKSNTSTSDFKDVPKDSYYYDAIKVGKALGIAQGSDSGKFEPQSNLTRQDAMALVYRTMEVTGKKLTKGTSTDMTQFSDRSMVSSYAYTAVATLVKANVIKGATDTGGKYKLNPKAQMTRAEMAVVLYRVLGL